VSNLLIPGKTFIEISGADRKKAAEAMEVVRDKLIADLDAKGIPASAILAGIAALDLGRFATLGLILFCYVILGTFLEGFAILVLTLPIVDPLIRDLGFDPIWFGVVMVIVLEMGLISPPVGVNVFVVKGVAGDVQMGDIFRGILPFWLAMIVCLALIVVFPDIAMLLPESMVPP